MSALPGSQGTRCAYALLSDPGRASVPSLHGTSVLPPVTTARRASATRLLSGLNPRASALAVYASGRHYGRLRKTHFRGWPAFPGGILLPTEFRWTVSALRPPPPLSLSWRDVVVLVLVIGSCLPTGRLRRRRRERGRGEARPVNLVHALVSVGQTELDAAPRHPTLATKGLEKALRMGHCLRASG